MFVFSLKYWDDDLLLPVINQISTDYKGKKKKEITYKMQYNYLYHVFNFYNYWQLQGQ